MLRKLPVIVPLLLVLSAAIPGLASRAFSKPLVITNSATFPPFSFLDENGEPQGVFVDLWREWAARNNRQISFLLVDWDQSLELVKTGKADIQAGLFRSKEREQYLDFSDGLFQLTTGLFVSSKLTVQHLKEIHNLTIGVTRGGFEENYLRNTLGHQNLTLYANNSLLVKAAVAGEIQAFVADYPVGMYFLHRLNSQEKFRLFKQLYSNTIRSAVKKGNTDLLNQINHGMKRIPREQKERIEQKWLRSEKVLPSWIIPAIATFVAITLLATLFTYIRMLKRHKRLLEETVEQRTLELKSKNKELEETLAEIKQLSGLLPICAQCKKIRDDEGYWKQIELYISEHSAAEFSHSICPDCASELYPGYVHSNNSSNPL